MITIWGRNNSINVQKPLWAASICGVEVNRKDVGGPFGGLDTEEYKSLNPNCSIPVMQDGDFTLWESNAIVRYLADRYGNESGFNPGDVRMRARANQWLDWVNSTFYMDLIPAFLQIYRVPEPQQDKALIAEKLGNLSKKLPLADSYFSSMGTDFTAGGQITFGDLGLGTLLYRYFNMPIERVACGNLRSYYDRLAQDEHFQTICMLPLK